MNLKTGILLVLVGIFAIVDIRKKEVPLAGLGLGAVIGIIWNLAAGELSAFAMAIGILPGFLLLLFCHGTGKGVGDGDSVLFMMIGIFTGMEHASAVMLASTAVFAVWAGTFLLLGRLRREQEVAFMPFIWLASVEVFLCM